MVTLLEVKESCHYSHYLNMMPQAAGKDAAPDRTLESVLKLPIISRDPVSIIVII